MKTIKVGLIGWGTVGTGVIKILKANGALISRRLGARLRIVRIADLNLKKDRGVRVSREILTTSASSIISDPDIQIVVELIGGIDPARKYISYALSRGKDVITANKALLAEKGRELFSRAVRARRNIFFEASVGGGIPVIKALREGLAANRINSILGIINGTANYILTRMAEEDITLPVALREAKRKGYAEPDPSLDLKGIDTAHKVVILASLAFGGWIDFRKVPVEGIGSITREDIAFTRGLGYTIKLLAIAKKHSDGVEIRVHPTLIPHNHLLSSVGGVYNAIYLRGDFSGQNMFYGQGAGPGPAASAVVADLIEAGRGILSGNNEFTPLFSEVSSLKILPFGEVECPHYIRIIARDHPGVLAEIAGIFASHRISIASVLQRGRREGGVVPLILMTHRARERSLQQALARINRLPIVKGPCLRLRVEE